MNDAEVSMIRNSDDAAPFSGLCFKIMTDPFVGSLTFCRIYSGTLEAGSYALNSNKNKKERIGRLMMMHANNREDIKVAFAGDIVAIGGLKDVVTGGCRKAGSKAGAVCGLGAQRAAAFVRASPSQRFATW